MTFELLKPLYNANQVTPQNRDRLLLIAINRFANTNRLHRFWKWPCQAGPSLQAYRAIVPLHDDWKDVIPPSDVLQQYMDPKLLPKGKFGSHFQKRCRRDVNSYRVRLPQDQFACLMASYGFAHEMPARVLQNGGLYGSLLLHDGNLRFLSEAEIIILQGAVENQWLTRDRRTNARILGNAIILPHAILGLINVFAFCNSDVDREDFQSVFCQAMSQRMHSENIHWFPCENGMMFTKKDFHNDDISTMPMRLFGKITIQSPIESWNCVAEYGVEIHEVLRHLLGPSLPSAVSLGIVGSPDCRVPLRLNFRLDTPQVVLRVDLPSALIVPVDAFKKVSEAHTTIVVLTSNGPIAMKHNVGMIVADVLNVIRNHSLMNCEDGLQCFSLLGEVVDGESIPPRCMIVSSASTSPDVDHAWKSSIVVLKAEQVFTFRGTAFELQSFLRFIDHTRCRDIIQALGWHFTKPAFQIPNDEMDSLFLTRSPGSLCALQDDLHTFLKGFLFVNILQKVKIEKDPNGIDCCLKLWDHYVWNAKLAPFALSRPIVEVWHAVTAFLGKPSSIRLIANGKSMNPDFPVSDYIQCPSRYHHRLLKIAVVVELHGGSGVTSPHSTCRMRNFGGNVMSIMEFDSEIFHRWFEQDFERTMGMVIQNWIDASKCRQQLCWESVANINFRIEKGIMFCKGWMQDLVHFVGMIDKIGVLDIIRMMGWFACPYSQSTCDEKESFLYFLPFPGRMHCHIQAVQSFLQAAITTSRLSENICDIEVLRLKIKLWGCHIFDNFVKISVTGQDAIDAWDFACSVSGFGSDVRLVAKGRQINPCKPLHIVSSRVDQYVCSVRLFFVMALQGGAPPIKDQSGLNRDAIALLYLSNGYDFKTAADVSHAICKSASTPAIQKALSQYPEEKKLKAFAALASSLSINIPDPNRLQKEVDLKTKNRLKGSEQHQKQLNVESLTIKKGYFLNGDSSDAIQRSSIMPSTAGIAVMNWNDAKQWLNRAETISQDELAILVVGECHGGGHGNCKRLSVPMYDDAENPMIVAGCLHNLGRKEIQISKGDNSGVAVGASSIVCFTVFRDEIDANTWGAIRQNPVKVILDIVVDKEENIQFPTPPWGRTWHDGKKKCKPEDAISMQFHARVANGVVSRILKASGQMGVYTVVKTPDKKVSQDFQVVWLDGSTIDLSVLLPKVINHQGLVRTFRSDGKINRGIRFLVKDFEAGFAVLKPGVDKPDFIPANFMFRISPTPVGATAENIRQWFKSLKQHAKPIRALGDSTWLCASSAKFEEEFLVWDEDMVLVKWLAPRYHQKQSPILASVRPVAQTSRPHHPKNNTKLMDCLSLIRGRIGLQEFVLIHCRNPNMWWIRLWGRHVLLKRHWKIVSKE